MKTKEEVIKEAWGKHWETLAERGKEQALEDSGYCNKNYVNSDLDCEIEVHSFPDTDFIRPKSIAGIENNNGWIRIENESDLPKDTEENLIYNAITTTGKMIVVYYNRSLRKICKYGTKKEVFGITHCQPIVKPKHPIY